ncbi:unnamed protein product [Phaeothamnion confervicola]
MAPSAGVPLAGAALSALAWVSVWTERNTALGAAFGGSLLAFSGGCFLSNVRLLPSAHVAYDVCWSTVLPMALAVIVLGGPHGREDDAIIAARMDKTAPVAADGTRRRRSSEALWRVAAAFAMGAAGTVVGACLAFRLATAAAAPAAVALPRATATRVAAVLIGTYVGGSINLFAVARAVGLSGAAAAGGASVLGAIAAADVLVMALYFAGLLAADRAPQLHRWFPDGAERRKVPVLTKRIAEERNGEKAVAAATERELSAFPEDGAVKRENKNVEVGVRKSLTDAAGLATAAAGTAALAAALCAAGTAAESALPMPGISTLVITALAAAAGAVLRRCIPQLHAPMAAVAPTLAPLLLNAFFAAVGASARLSEVAAAGPALLIFASITITVHAAFLTAGALAANAALTASTPANAADPRPRGIALRELLVASNANVGGAGTAAAFAGVLGSAELVVPAAVCGTAGYAFATGLGVLVYHILTKW